MKFLLFLSIFLAAACLSQPTSATPDDMITVEDEAFAANSDTLFVMRTVQDNLGLHTSTYAETFLVGIDVKSGEETHWLVYRARHDRVFSANAEEEGVETTLFDRETWHDPHAIVADAGASLAPTAVRGETTVLDHGETIAMGYDYGPRFEFQRDDALTAARRSLIRLQDHVGEAPRMSMLTTRDIWDERAVDWDSCAFSSVGYPANLGAQAFQIVRVHCHDGYEGSTTSLLQAIPVSSRSD